MCAGSGGPPLLADFGDLGPPVLLRQLAPVPEHTADSREQPHTSAADHTAVNLQESRGPIAEHTTYPRWHSQKAAS